MQRNWTAGERLALGALAGTLAAAALAPLLRPLFHPPAGGVGFVTVHQSPKGFDYFVIAMLAGGSFAGAWLMSHPLADWPSMRERWRGRTTWIASLLVVAAMFLLHDSPYSRKD